ncbi:hypothetical protein BDZ89DRAFT_1142870 [Hymenopellis radicata]|nr:hypothetical protein BDZ89DRAFT_1142870 [Hymenopellis radicata]
MVDTVPAAEILSMVEDLNSDIFQTAATIADGLFSRDYELANTIMEHGEHWLGINLAHLLYSARHRDPDSRSLIIQTVIQAALTQTSLDVTLLWDAALNGSSLDYTYQKIRATFSQSVGARWRVLTRANTKYVDPSIVEKAALARIVSILSIVLSISGWMGGVTSNWDSYRQTVETQFQPDLEQIVKDVVTLDRAMGEGLVSMDAELVVIGGGALFDASFMENAFGDDDRRVSQSSEGDGSAAIVGCTCDLGLQIKEGDREGGGVRTRLLLKPKVVLWSALLDAPQTDTERL